ncbi:MAG: hypothetical protein ACT4TC_22340 [Myxococcaceae bacterium]
MPLSVAASAALLLAGAAGWWGGGGAGTAEAAANSPGWSQGKKGPWGQLELFDFEIRAPELAYSAGLCAAEPVSWHFPRFDASGLQSFLRSAGIAPGLLEELQRTFACSGPAPGCWAQPSQAVIFGLSPKARDVIYRELSKYPVNDPYFYGTRRRERDLDAWLADFTLSGRDTIRKMIWSREGTAILSNYASTCALLKERTDRETFIRKISTRPALLVRLKAPASTNLNSLLDYWGDARHSSEIEPLLRAMVTQGPVLSVDIIHLLPGFFRSHLYAFPTPQEVDADCHWSAANYHAFIPPNRAVSPTGAPSQEVQGFFRGLTPVRYEDRTLGDVLQFLIDGQPVHSCVYIADDVVFTKNGVSNFAPWQLMRLKDLRELYLAGRETTVVVGRNPEVRK